MESNEMTRPPVDNRLQAENNPMRLTATQLMNVLELLNNTSSTTTTTTTTTTITTSLNPSHSSNYHSNSLSSDHSMMDDHNNPLVFHNDTATRISSSSDQPQQQPCDYRHSHHTHHHDKRMILNNQVSTTNAHRPSDGFVDRLMAYLNDRQTFQGVSVPSVRDIVAQYWLQIILILVIIIYLIYYFTKVSKKPKLIGQNNSKFVQFIRDNLKQSVNYRFSPLMYFWGANAQTALFGYLQGRTSLSESERDLSIKRQYLYVSDLQYLTSNKDLSRYYENRKQQVRVQLRATNLLEDYDQTSASLAYMQYMLNKTSNFDDEETDGNNHHNNQEENHNDHYQHNQNIRIALDNMVHDGAVGDKLRNHKNLRIIASSSNKRTVDSTYSCASCCSSSTDSGVFGANHSGQSSTISSSGHSTGSSRASTSSLNGPTSEEGYSSSGDNSMDPTIIAPASAAIPSLAKIGKQMTNSSDQQQKNKQHQQKCGNLDNQRPKSLFDVYSAKKHPNKERLEFGQCALDWFVSSHENYHKNKLVALISAGMTTGSDKRYVTDTVETLESLGYECCVFIRRGVGGLKLSSAKFFSPAKWRDFEAAVQSVKQQRPDAKLVGVGFSFGSIELCRYLAMSGKQSHIDAALLVSCPFDPVCGGENMHNGSYLNRRIDAYLAKNLGKQLYEAMFPASSSSSSSSSSNASSTLSSCDDLTTTSESPEKNSGLKNKLTSDHENAEFKNSETTKQTSGKRSLKENRKEGNSSKKKCQIWTNENGSSINLAVLPKLKSLHDFEYGYNRIVQHYPSREAYAQDCELELSTIAVPTLCLSSEDDFMAPKNLLPIDQIKANPNLCMLLTNRGGHMAFVDGLVWPRKPYFAQRIISDYMGAIRNTYNQEKQHHHQIYQKHHEKLEKESTGSSLAGSPQNIQQQQQQTGSHIAIDLHHHHHHHHYIHSTEDNK